MSGSIQIFINLFLHIVLAMESICTAMAKQEGVTELLKASGQMEWVCV